MKSESMEAQRRAGARDAMRSRPARLALGCVLVAVHVGSVTGFSTAARLPMFKIAPLQGPRDGGATVAYGRRTEARAGLRTLIATPMAAGKGPEARNATMTLTSDGFKTKANMNAGRKIFHACSGVALALAYDLFLTRMQATVVFGVSFLVLTTVEVLRLRYAQNAISKFVFARFRRIARDYETNQVGPSFGVASSGAPGPFLRPHFLVFLLVCRSVAGAHSGRGRGVAWQLSGMVYYLAGVTLAVAAYPKKVGVLAILFLALGDPFASTMGIKFGKLGPRFANGKSLIGSLAGLTICALTTAIYFSRGVQDWLTLALVSLLGGLAGSAPSPFPL